MRETGNKSGVNRRSVLLTAASAAPLLALMSSQVKAGAKQTTVKYQAEPKDGKQCDGCNYFVAPNSCKVVDGEVSPTGYCLLWTKKAA